MSEENSEDPFPKFDWETLTTARPNEIDGGMALTTGDLLRLLQPGDEIIWGEGDEDTRRVYPMTVVERNEGLEKRYDTGAREIAWTVEGPQGGQYTAGNWWHWGKGGEGPEDITGLYPQSHRTSGEGWDGDMHFYELATDFPVYRHPSDFDEVAEGSVIIHTSHKTDRHHAGVLKRVEFGQPVLSAIDGLPVSDAEYTIEPEQVVVYRPGGGDD